MNCSLDVVEGAGVEPACLRKIYTLLLFAFPFGQPSVSLLLIFADVQKPNVFATKCEKIREALPPLWRALFYPVYFSMANRPCLC